MMKSKELIFRPGVNWGTAHQWIPGVNQGSKCQLSMSCIVGGGPGGTLGVHTFTCETWHSLWLLVQDLPVLTQHLSNAQVSQCWSTG